MQDTLVVSAALDPYRLEVYDMLCSGWSVTRIYRYLEAVRHAKVPLQDIISMLASIPESDILPKTVLQKEFAGADIEIDAIGEMARLLRLQSERIGVALLLEKAVGERVPYVETASRVYWVMLREYVSTKQLVGEMPIPSSSNLPAVVDAQQQQLPRLRDLIINNFPTVHSPSDKDDIVDGEVVVKDLVDGPQSYTRAPSH